MRLRKIITIWFSILMIVTIILPGCGCSPSPYIKATLAFSEPPILGKEVKVTATFTLTSSVYQKASDVKAEIVLPEGIEKVDGDLQFQGDFLLGQIYEIKAIVKTTKTGLWKVVAKAFFSPAEGDYLGGTKEIWVNVIENAATVSDRLGALSSVVLISSVDSPTGYEKDKALGTALETIPPKKEITPDQIPNPISSVENKEMNTLTNSLTITGGFYCLISENSVPVPDVEREDVERPMVWGGVYAYNARTDDFLGSATTGMGANAGVFNITIDNPYPDGFYLWVIPISSVAEVKDGDTDYIMMPTQTWYPQENEPVINVGWFTIGNSYPEYTDAWRIYETMANDDFNRGAYYFLYLNGYQMPCVQASYPDETPFFDTSWYNPTSQILHIKYSYDTKALDTVLHEYGHRVWHEVQGTFTIYWDHLSHKFGDVLDPGQAFEENWGDFFAMAVQNDPIYEFGDGAQTNLETKGWYDWPYGDNVDGRVAGALWDLLDTNPETYDNFSMSFSIIWHEFSTGLPESTLAEFWNHLLPHFSYPIPPARSIFQNTIIYPELRLYLTTNSTAGGDVTVPGESTYSYEHGQVVNITATPIIGYHFVNWTGDVGTIANPNSANTTITMNRDYTIWANFAPDTGTPPSVTTDSATNITSNSVILNGTLTDKGSASVVTVSFQYGTSPENYPWETSGQRMSSIGFFDISQGGLSPGTTYYYRAKAVGDATDYGAEMQFTTTAGGTTPPSVTTDSATDITSSSVILNGTLTDKGSASIVTVSFQYGTSPGYYPYETSSQQMSSTGTFAISQSGLSPGTTYYYRAKAVGDATGYGAEMQFTTATGGGTPPSGVLADVAGPTTATSTMLVGWVSSLGSAQIVYVYFEWGTTTSYGNTVTAFPSFITPQNQSLFYATLNGLSPGTTYHFRAKAVGDGIGYSNDVQFTTLSDDTTAPSAVTNLAVDTPTSTSLRLTWTAPGDDGSTGTATQYDIRYSTAAINEGNWASATQVTGEPTPLVAGSAQSFVVNGLSPSTTYYFAIKTADEVPNWSAISNSPGGTTTAAGPIVIITISCGESTTPPSVTTSTPSNITSTSATLNGSLTSLGSTTSVIVSFEWGLTTSYGNTAAGTPSPLTAPGTFTGNLTGLTPGTTYHFRAKADGGAAGVSYGADQQFMTTAAGPVVIISINTN